MKAAGSSLVVSELVSELPWGQDQEIIVMHPDGYFSPIDRAEVVQGQVHLEIDADPDSDKFRALLDDVAELLDDLSPKDVKLTTALRHRINVLANQIEEAL